MLASTAISDVRKELLEYGAALFWSDAELLRYLNRGLMDYAGRVRILENRAYMTLEQGRADYPLPSDWISARLVLHNLPDADGKENWRRLYPVNIEKLAQENPNFLDVSSDRQDRPRRYFIWGSSMYFTPAPDADSETTVQLFYKAKPSEITLTTESLPFDDTLNEGIEHYMLWKAWNKEKEFDLAEENKQMYSNYISEGLRFIKKKVGDMRNQIDIDSPISFYSNPNPFDPLF
jgi:hypothetical protein